MQVIIYKVIYWIIQITNYYWLYYDLILVTVTCKNIQIGDYMT